MSFFNETSACQAASNPLSKIVDTTNNEHHNLNGISSSQSGRTSQIPQTVHHFQNIDSSIQHEFDNFSSPGHNFQLNNELSHQKMELNEFAQPFSHQMSMQHQPQQNSWVSDFRSFSLSDSAPQISQHQQQQPNQRQQMSNFAHPLSSLNRHTTHIQSPNMSISSNHQNVGLEHPSTTSLKELNNEFDNAFTEVENEINIVSSTQNQSSIEEEESTKVVNDEEDKIKFAILAQNVFNMMNNTPKHVSSSTSNKFKQSGFMQLMNKISNREIEVSNDKQKLVDQNGKDIRSDLSDPLANLQINDLLDSPFNSALKVSQNTVVKVDLNSWQGDFV